MNWTFEQIVEDWNLFERNGRDAFSIDFKKPLKPAYDQPFDIRRVNLEDGEYEIGYTIYSEGSPISNGSILLTVEDGGIETSYQDPLKARLLEIIRLDPHERNRYR